MKQKIKYKFLMEPAANPQAIVQGKYYRFTLLTSRLIRLEYSEEGKFEDHATQVVINRKFPPIEYRVLDTKESLEIITEHLHLTYNKKKFSQNGLSIQVKGNLSAYRSIWAYGQRGENLKGTARTLDESDGAIQLEDGLLSRNGYAVVDDSKSILLTEDGWVMPRMAEAEDIYFFGYGRDYLGCLKDFYHLCGRTPMLPRYVLGNWWSRFHPYTEDSYKSLVQKFETEKVPFSMAVLDMDWHLTKVDEKYGSGWTGYTWNRDYFPEPEKFLYWLHKKGMHVTLNVHPADGIRAFEEMYLPMAQELGVDYAREDKIPFDISNIQFMEAYFKYLHHPQEEIGVDFWWVDWQQGGTCSVEGLDPLWMLNHYHYLDCGREGKQAVTFSRYAGLGSHRYPIGFSGDSFATWDTLRFQPYFTATASNAGYGWWSHDIGGHMHGEKNDEMLVRWIQFGVFSPIMRIHSSDNPFFVKEPWKYNSYIGGIISDFLRLRHQLVPYLYTMNYRAREEGIPLIQPMYYLNPEQEEAYQVPNEYYFGSELIACPITEPVNPELRIGAFNGWLPAGTYFDFFTGRIYRGDRKLIFERGLEGIPVFAKAGAIIPMVPADLVENSLENPGCLLIKVFAGAEGAFDLYEDNQLESGLDKKKEVITHMHVRWGKDLEFQVDALSDYEGVIKDARSYEIQFIGIADSNNIIAAESSRKIQYKKIHLQDVNSVLIKTEPISVNSAFCIKVKDVVLAENRTREQAFELLDKAQIQYDLKNEIYRIISKNNSKADMISEIQSLPVKTELMSGLVEIITAY